MAGETRPSLLIQSLIHHYWSNHGRNTSLLIQSWREKLIHHYWSCSEPDPDSHLQAERAAPLPWPPHLLSTPLTSSLLSTPLTSSPGHLSAAFLLSAGNSECREREREMGTGMCNSESWERYTHTHTSSLSDSALSRLAANHNLPHQSRGGRLVSHQAPLKQVP